MSPERHERRAAARLMWCRMSGWSVAAGVGEWGTGCPFPFGQGVSVLLEYSRPDAMGRATPTLWAPSRPIGAFHCRPSVAPARVLNARGYWDTSRVEWMSDAPGRCGRHSVASVSVRRRRRNRRPVALVERVAKLLMRLRRAIPTQATERCQRTCQGSFR